MQAEPVGLVAEYVKRVMSQAKSDDKQKLRGLYVDYRRGKILLPSQISERMARRQIKLVREALSGSDRGFPALTGRSGTYRAWRNGAGPRPGGGWRVNSSARL